MVVVVVAVHFINRFRRCSFNKKIPGYRASALKKRLGRCCIRGARRARWIGNEVVFNRTRKRWTGWGERDRIFFDRRLVVRVDLQAGGSKRRLNARGLAIEDNGKEAEYDYRIYGETEKEGQTDKMR